MHFIVFVKNELPKKRFAISAAGESTRNAGFNKLGKQKLLKL